MKEVFVTGAHGAIGSHVVKLLLEKGCIVGGLGNGPSQWAHESAIDHWLPGPVTTEMLADLADQMGEPDVIFHLAGGSSVGASLADPMLDFHRTVESTMSILEWIRASQYKTRIVYASSAAVYGENSNLDIVESAPINPKSPYGLHKRMAEQLITYWSEHAQIPAAIVRLFSVYGPGLHKQLIYDLSKRLLDGGEQLEMFGSGDEQRDWLWIGDAAQFLVTAATHAMDPPLILNGCTGRGPSVRNIAQTLKEISGQPCELKFAKGLRSGDPDNLVGSAKLSHAKKLIPSVGLEDGLKYTFDYNSAERKAGK